MIIEKAYAKINLGLDIVGKRPDGYHNIDTVMQSISLCDYVTLERTSGIRITCNNPAVPTDGGNTAHKAALLFFDYAKLSPKKNGVSITIEKNIPMRAGLGGGSSDAASVLRGLDKLYCTNYSTVELLSLASRVGSDVPFCISGGTQRITGCGEILQPLDSFSEINILILMPNESVDTAFAYSLFSESEAVHHPDMDKIIGLLQKRDLDLLGPSLENTFEFLLFPKKIGRAHV